MLFVTTAESRRLLLNLFLSLRKFSRTSSCHSGPGSTHDSREVAECAKLFNSMQLSTIETPLQQQLGLKVDNLPSQAAMFVSRLKHPPWAPVSLDCPWARSLAPAISATSACRASREKGSDPKRARASQRSQFLQRTKDLSLAAAAGTMENQAVILATVHVRKSSKVKACLTIKRRETLKNQTKITVL